MTVPPVENREPCPTREKKLNRPTDRAPTGPTAALQKALVAAAIRRRAICDVLAFATGDAADATAAVAVDGGPTAPNPNPL